MQGIESLDKFKNFVSSIGGLGRYEDTYIVHAAEGETVVPMEVLNKNPVLKERLFESMRDMGIEPERYIVGNELNSINPITGQPEFFLKKIFKRIKKGVRDIGSRLRKAAADVSGYAAPIIGAMYGPLAGAGIGALLGQFKRENPGDPNQALQMALRGGISGIGTNLATGQGIMGTGLSNQYGFNPINIGKGVLGFPTEISPDSILPAGTDGIPVERFVPGRKQFVEGGKMNILEGLQRTFMKPGGKGISDLKIFDFLKSTGVDPNVKVSDAKAGGFLDNLLSKLGINKTALVFAGIYGTKALGDAIKEEYEKAAKEREEKFGGPFGERGTDEQL